MFKKLMLSSMLFVAGVAMAQEQVVNLYSARHYQTDEALYANFTKATGIKVNRVDADDAGILARLKAEGTASPADVIMLVDVARLWKGDAEGLFMPIKSPLLEKAIPLALRAKATPESRSATAPDLMPPWPRSGCRWRQPRSEGFEPVAGERSAHRPLESRLGAPGRPAPGRYGSSSPARQSRPHCARSDQPRSRRSTTECSQEGVRYPLKQPPGHQDVGRAECRRTDCCVPRHRMKSAALSCH